jgi:starvation-inducible DNA-binding protein
MKSNSVTQMKNIPKVTSDLGDVAVAEISEVLRKVLADIFALYVKTKNFHWHMSGTHLSDYHLLLDEQAGQIFARTDEIAKRARKLGGTTLRSISDISKHQRLRDNNAEFVAPSTCSASLRLTTRISHEVCVPPTNAAGRTTTSPPPARLTTGTTKLNAAAWFLSEIVTERLAAVKD